MKIDFPWTDKMDDIWRKANLISETNRAYGQMKIPPVHSHFPRPRSEMFLLLLFCATHSEEEVEKLTSEVRKDMIDWKARVKAYDDRVKPKTKEERFKNVNFNL